MKNNRSDRVRARTADEVKEVHQFCCISRDVYVGAG